MKDLSVVIPCYNEERVFHESMERILALLALTRLDYEIILIDDHSTDKTRDLIRGITKKEKRISSHFHETNKGRGAAVMEGIRRAKGRVVGYIDIDLEVPESNILSHYLEIERGYDVAYAERITPHYLVLHPRTLFHFLYISLSGLILHSSFGDTNAGCKFFRRSSILPIVETVQDPHWFWDTEILFRSARAGLRLKKIPVIYVRNKNKKSTVRVFSDSVYFLKRLIRFSREMRGGK